MRSLSLLFWSSHTERATEHTATGGSRGEHMRSRCADFHRQHFHSGGSGAIGSPSRLSTETPAHLGYLSFHPSSVNRRHPEAGDSRGTISKGFLVAPQRDRGSAKNADALATAHLQSLKLTCFDSMTEGN